MRSMVKNLVGPQEPLLATAKRRKLPWHGHVTLHNSLSKTILQGTDEGGRRRGRQRKIWSDNSKEWTDITTPDLMSTAANRPAWRRTSTCSALKSPRRLSMMMMMSMTMTRMLMMTKERSDFFMFPCGRVVKIARHH